MLKKIGLTLAGVIIASMVIPPVMFIWSFFESWLEMNF